MSEETKNPEQQQAKLERTGAKTEKKQPKEVAKQKAQPEEKPQLKQKNEANLKKKKKINRLTLQELEKKLQEVQQKMGGLSSFYAQQLLKRKEQLLTKNKTEQELENAGNNET